MKLWIILTVLVACGVLCVGAFDILDRPTHNLLLVNYIAIEELDKNLCNLTVKIRRPRNKVGHFIIDFHLFVPIYYAKATWTLLIKRSSNVFQPTVINNISLELCTIVKNNATLLASTKFLTPLYPEMYDAMKDYIHPCPYLPRHYHIEHTVERMKIPWIMEAREYKSMIRVADAQNKTIGSGYMSMTIKPGFPPAKRKDK